MFSIYSIIAEKGSDDPYGKYFCLVVVHTSAINALTTFLNSLSPKKQDAPYRLFASLDFVCHYDDLRNAEECICPAVSQNISCTMVFQLHHSHNHDKVWSIITMSCYQLQCIWKDIVKYMTDVLNIFLLQCSQML